MARLYLMVNNNLQIDLELIRNTAQIPIWEKPLPGSQLSQRLRKYTQDRSQEAC